MAAALAWTADRDAGVDSPVDRGIGGRSLMRSTNRIHHDTAAADAPPSPGRGGVRIGVGDVVISRRNDPIIIEVYAGDLGGSRRPLADAPGA